MIEIVKQIHFKIQDPMIQQVDIKRKEQNGEVESVEKEKSEQKEDIICIKEKIKNKIE